MTLEPKKRFRESPFHKPWHEATEAEWFHHGLQNSLLVMMHDLDIKDDACANYHKLEGAKKLVRIMLSLTESAPQRKPTIVQNLDHTV